MQFLITVNDPENGLGSGTERHFTERFTELVEMFGRMPGIVASIETHEEDVYGSGEEPYTEVAPGISVPSLNVATPVCDICGRAQGDSPNVLRDDQPADWNPETGNHRTCDNPGQAWLESDEHPTQCAGLSGECPNPPAVNGYCAVHA